MTLKSAFPDLSRPPLYWLGSIQLNLNVRFRSIEFSANIIETLNITHYLASAAFDLLVTSVAKAHLSLSSLHVHSVPNLRPAFPPRPLHVAFCFDVVLT